MRCHNEYSRRAQAQHVGSRRRRLSHSTAGLATIPFGWSLDASMCLIDGAPQVIDCPMSLRGTLFYIYIHFLRRALPMRSFIGVGVQSLLHVFCVIYRVPLETKFLGTPHTVALTTSPVHELTAANRCAYS